jgi:hypothetical protein
MSRIPMLARRVFRDAAVFAAVVFSVFEEFAEFLRAQNLMTGHPLPDVGPDLTARHLVRRRNKIFGEPCPAARTSPNGSPALKKMVPAPN